MKINMILLLLALSFTRGQNAGSEFKIYNYNVGDTLISFRGICAVDENEVWVSGSRGSVYCSDNGGKSFKKIEISGAGKLDFRDVHKIANNKIVVMSAGTGSDSRIYLSDDNGKSWNMTYENKHKDGFFDSIEFWDEKNGILMGDPLNSELNILLTSDGGMNWSEADTGKIPDVIPGEAGFAASGSCLSVWGKDYVWIGTGGAAARIFASADRGKTWKVYATPLLSGKPSTGIFSVLFISEDEGFITGGDYTDEKASFKTAAVTNNGGRSWQLLPDGSLPYQSCVKDFGGSENHVYVSTGPSGSYYSKNKIDWNKLGESGFHCLGVSKSKTAVWLAGSNGRIAKILKGK